MKKGLKTKTLGNDGQPELTILKGRHTVHAFNKAFIAEGWSPGNGWKKDDGLFGYRWFRKTRTGFVRSDVKDLKAELYTVGEW